MALLEAEVSEQVNSRGQGEGRVEGTRRDGRHHGA